MKYTVTILKLAEKFIVKLPKPEKERVLKAIYQLPEGNDIKELRGKKNKGLYRLRVGDIVGKNQEHIILDYDAPFDISEYKNIFMLNETLENISDCGLEDDMLTALFKVNSDRDEVMEAIENGSNRKWHF